MSFDPSHIRGVLFDLWNTLSYSEFQPNPMLLIAEALGLAGLSDWKKRIERGMMRKRHRDIDEALSALERETGREIGDARARERLIRSWNEACAATRLFDDALPALRAVRGRFRIGILSNTQSFDLGFIGTLGIEPLVDAVCLSCDEGRLKPDPLFFAAAAERLRLPAREVLMVGDSVEDDVLGALQAGFAALHLDRKGGAPPVPGAAGIVRVLTEVPSLLT